MAKADLGTILSPCLILQPMDVMCKAAIMQDTRYQGDKMEKNKMWGKIFVWGKYMQTFLKHETPQNKEYTLDTEGPT